MPRKVHNHDIKSAYRNDGERQEWRGGIEHICYNKRCQAGVRTRSHAFLYIPVSNAWRDFQRHGARSLHPITIECRPLYSFTLQSEDKKHKYTCERTAFCRRQRTNWPLNRWDPEDCRGICQCIIKIRPQDQHKKTEVMFQPNSTTIIEEDINVDETTLNSVKKFTYLGSIIARDGHIEAEQQRRMSKASMSFGRLRERLE